MRKNSRRRRHSLRGSTSWPDYIRGEEENIAEYRHELWRLANWRQAPEAGDVPFHEQRITAKAGETTAKLWRLGESEVGAIEDGLRNDLQCHPDCRAA